MTIRQLVVDNRPSRHLENVGIDCAEQNNGNVKDMPRMIAVDADDEMNEWRARHDDE